jgi:hypothetical protein
MTDSSTSTTDFPHPLKATAYSRLVATSNGYLKLGDTNSAIAKLGRDNYRTWEPSMKMQLAAAGVLGMCCVGGTPSRPIPINHGPDPALWSTTDADWADWDVVKARVRAFLLDRCDETFKSAVSHHEELDAMWDALRLEAGVDSLRDRVEVTMIINTTKVYTVEGAEAWAKTIRDALRAFAAGGGIEQDMDSMLAVTLIGNLSGEVWTNLRDRLLADEAA